MHLRHAACEQTCNVCGQVCPTGAIRNLSLIEKQYAKVGTAALLRDRCLAWAQNKRCLICDEQCPYNAIVTIREPQHTVGVPVVIPDKCNGCGQCEDKCPVLGESAIIVSPHGELRLTEGSYVAKAKELGLMFEAEQTMHDQIWDEPPAKAPASSSDTRPPNDSNGASKLPPGIIQK
jgi:MinD superfamily P-loop ATPase containing an inserted ferredoxin domain